MKKFVGSFLACLALLAAPLSARAAAYRGFTYDSRGDAIPSRIGYLPQKTYRGPDFGPEVGDLSNPQDLCVSENGDVYILDSGNGRVLVLDRNMRFKRVLSHFVAEGEEIGLRDPSGLFVDRNGTLYIADPGAGRVLVSNGEGRVLRILGAPETSMLPADLEFKPRRVLADSAGMIYVTATGIYQGAVLYRPDGSFEGFFGSNEVEVSAALLLDKFWKSVLTDEQAGNISKYVPEEFTSFDIDERDFVYTVTQSGEIRQKIKKLNPMGDNILSETEFGETEIKYVGGALTASAFIDVCVGVSGTFNALDRQSNRIFQYDREGRLLFVFGGTGDQAGTFRRPAAVEALDDRILVLDSAKGNLTVFAPTEFGEAVHRAMEYYNDGRYAESAELWHEILRLDRNFEIGHKSIGKALLAEKKYREALPYFEAANDKIGHSDAFEGYRNQMLRKIFPFLTATGVGLAILFLCLPKKRKNRIEAPRKIGPLRFLLRPVESAEEMKQQKAASYPKALLILLLWFAATVFRAALTGFRFNAGDPSDLNIPLIFLGTVPLFCVWVVSNLGVCTLTDGKGRFKDIFVGNAYCLVPYVASLFVNVALSQVLTTSEQIFMTWIQIIGAVWSLVLLLGVLAGVHEYTFARTAVTFFLSLVGVAVVTFLLLLAASLLRQAYAFVFSVVNELIYRFGRT